MGAFVAEGDRMPYTPGSAVAVGAVVVVGDTVGVADRPIAANTLGSLAVEGAFAFPKSAGAIAAGVVVYWDAGASAVTITASTNKRVGKVYAAALDADTTVVVILNLA